jgi:CMP-N,N'-diacetyllegionaminic acid synthase
MLNGKTFLAVIPARGGSKRLPRKNVLKLAGKPLIAWTVEAAKNSKYIDRIIVSSDDTEILQIADDLKVENIKRPDKLANDTSSTFSVVEHVIRQCNSNFDFILLLQPTSPLRNAAHIDEAIELLMKRDADAIISVCETEHSPLWANTLPDNGSMEAFVPQDFINTRSQDLPKYFRLNGAIYICNTDKFKQCQTLLIDSNIYAYEMTQASSVDIDTQIDFSLAEIQLNANK